MSDSTPGLPRKQTRIGPKYFEDEPPRYSGHDDEVRLGGPRRGRMKVSSPPLQSEPVGLTRAPQPGDPLYEGTILHQAIAYAFGIDDIKYPGTETEVPPMTMEQQRIMDQVVWRLKNGD